MVASPTRRKSDEFPPTHIWRQTPNYSPSHREPQAGYSGRAGYPGKPSSPVWQDTWKSASEGLLCHQPDGNLIATTASLALQNLSRDICSVKPEGGHRSPPANCRCVSLCVISSVLTRKARSAQFISTGPFPDYPISRRAACGWAFAWASIAVPA